MNEFKQLLERMDWTYQFSDHYGTFEKGRADMWTLQHLARELGPEARAMLEKALAHHHV
jgi:hypothetical protein